jgi:hypothetical protein
MRNVKCVYDENGIKAALNSLAFYFEGPGREFITEATRDEDLPQAAQETQEVQDWEDELQDETLDQATFGPFGAGGPGSLECNGAEGEAALDEIRAFSGEGRLECTAGRSDFTVESDGNGGYKLEGLFQGRMGAAPKWLTPYKNEDLKSLAQPKLGVVKGGDIYVYKDGKEIGGIFGLAQKVFGAD